MKLRKITGRKFLPVLAFVMMATMVPDRAPAQDKIEKYIDRYRGLAVQLMHEYCIPASLILGVAIQESGACSSRNCRLLNNHFGIKAGKKYRIPGTEHVTAYRTYENDTASFVHFCQWVSKRKFYPSLWDQTDYTVWVRKMSESGYAMAKESWQKKVLFFIRKYGLAELDVY